MQRRVTRGPTQRCILTLHMHHVVVVVVMRHFHAHFRPCVIHADGEVETRRFRRVLRHGGDSVMEQVCGLMPRFVCPRRSFFTAVVLRVQGCI